jgi:plastocyanin
MRQFLTVSVIAALAAVLTSTVAAQGTTRVSGQVTILERPGETTEDLGNVVVYLEPASASSRVRPPVPSPPPTNTVIVLQSRQFSPRVRVVMEGSKVEFPNQDPFSHNVFSKMNGGFDTGVYGRGKVRDQTFRDPGVYPLYCNVHPRMTAFVITLKTPYFVQAGADGRFVLEQIPAGRYMLHVWHDRTTESVKALVVPAVGVSNVRVELDGRGYKYVQHKNKFGKDYTSATGDRY